MITLKNFKARMIEKAEKRGEMWEDFGQIELKKLIERLTESGFDPYGQNDKDIETKEKLQELNQWAMHFNL